MTEQSIRPDTWRHIEKHAVQSTNAECMELAREGDSGGVWITADHQIQGRGRRGRKWTSDTGNLYASLLLIDPAPLKQLSYLPLAVSIAANRAIRRSISSRAEHVKIKWPNDILVDGSKICGMLIEVEEMKNGRRAVVIGCGINVAHSPDNTLYPATSLRELGSTISVLELFSFLYQEMGIILEKWVSEPDASDIRKDWIDLAQGIGQSIEVKLPNETLSGRFVGLNEDGCLMLSMHDGRSRVISAGDVFFKI